jgi:Uma2 family endonuclease
MVLEAVKPLTAEAFEQIALLTENADKRLEFIGGRIVEVVSNNYSSELGANVLGEFRMFIKGKGLGRVTGADGGYIINGERYIPDAAFISKAKQPAPSRAAYNPIPPDLAVEVLSPTDKPTDVANKVANYLLAGVVLWLIDPDEQLVTVFVPHQTPQKLTMNDTLDGGGVLPGFTLAVKDIFAS